MEINSARQNYVMKNFRVNVTNIGPMDGILAFITSPQLLRDGQAPPIKQLFGFERMILRVNLRVNETKQVFFPFDIQTLFGSKWLHPRQYRILIGKQHMFTVELYGDSALWKRFK
jgi:hypothetical protein